MSSALTSSDMLYFTDRGSGPPLLLVHGLMVTGEMFDPVVDQFATRHRVIVPDLRGHGRSRALPPPYMVRQLHLGCAGGRGHAGRHRDCQHLVPGLPGSPARLGGWQPPLSRRGSCPLRRSRRPLVGRHRVQLSEHAPLPVGRAREGMVPESGPRDGSNSHTPATVGTRPRLVRRPHVPRLATSNARGGRGGLHEPGAHRRVLAIDRQVILEGDDVEANLDRGKLERILDNLIGNAVRYTPPGARIWVAVRRSPRRGPAHGGGRRAGVSPSRCARRSSSLSVRAERWFGTRPAWASDRRSRRGSPPQTPSLPRLSRRRAEVPAHPRDSPAPSAGAGFRPCDGTGGRARPAPRPHSPRPSRT